MEAIEFQSILVDLFWNEEQWAEQTEIPVDEVETFKSAGVLTTDRGLVVSLEDGSEFQITIVQSKGSKW